MKKIYCVYCGEENKIEDPKCKKCHKKLSPKNHPWKDYFYDHIKDNLKDKVTDKLSSLIINYVKSNFYGVILSVAIIVTATTGMVSAVNNEESEPSNVIEVTKKPIILTGRREISLEDRTVQRLYEYNQVNKDSKLNKGFYEGQFITQDAFTDFDKIAFTYLYKNPAKEEKELSSCEELKDYERVYQSCLLNQDLFLNQTDYHMVYYKVDMDLFKSTYQQIFGTNQELPKGDYAIQSERQCEYSKKTKAYLCYSIPSGWIYPMKEATKLVKAIKDENTIELYDYVLFYIEDDTYTDKGVYTDHEREHKIADDYNPSLLEQGQLYKHVYQKDQNGNYYWYSSGPITTPLNEIE